VYNTFLAELERWNDAHQSNEDNTIRTVLITGLGIGQEGISLKRSAQQMVLAVKHFQDGIRAHV